MLLSIEGLREDRILQNVSKLHTMLLNLEILACKVCIYVLILRMYIVLSYLLFKHIIIIPSIITLIIPCMSYLIIQFCTSISSNPSFRTYLQYECSRRHFTDSYSSAVTDLVYTLRGYVHKYKSQLQLLGLLNYYREIRQMKQLSHEKF